VTPEYFQLIGIPLLRGRLFNEFDSDTAPQVAVVNEALRTATGLTRTRLANALNRQDLAHRGSKWWA
jgi:hypothetical protein